MEEEKGLFCNCFDERPNHLRPNLWRGRAIAERRKRDARFKLRIYRGRERESVSGCTHAVCEYVCVSVCMGMYVCKHVSL